MFWSALLLFYAIRMNHFSIGLWCTMKSGFYTTGNDQLSVWTKKKLQSTSQSQTSIRKKVMVTVWWSAAHLIHYSFLNPDQTITSEKYTQQIDEIQWKLQCLQPALFNGKEPNSSPWQWLTTSHTNKSWRNWAKKFWLICHIHLTSHQLTTTTSSILTTLFVGKMLPKPTEGRKCFPRVHQTLKHGFFTLQE